MASTKIPADNLNGFLKGVSHNTSLLYEAVAEKNLMEFDAIIWDVEQDFIVKSKMQRNGHGAGATYPGIVQLSVDTVKDGVNVSGYQILLKPKRYKGASYYYTLNKLSSPATGKIEPGRYDIAAALGGKVKYFGTVLIGINEDQTKIELPVK